MNLGERIKTCRQKAGMSQEKVAELMGVSRQAVTKWEIGQSAPNTENLFNLAEIFGTTVDFLLSTEEASKPSPAEQIYYLYKMEEEQKKADRDQKMKENLITAMSSALWYIAIYLVGRAIWCDFSESSLLGWLITATPSGNHSYLYGWLLIRNLFWYAMALSVVAGLLGKQKISVITSVAFLLGIVLGIIFGPNPEGAALGHGDYGWAIWGVTYLISIILGILAEHFIKKNFFELLKTRK